MESRDRGGGVKVLWRVGTVEAVTYFILWRYVSVATVLVYDREWSRQRCKTTIMNNDR